MSIWCNQVDRHQTVRISSEEEITAMVKIAHIKISLSFFLVFIFRRVRGQGEEEATEFNEDEPYIPFPCPIILQDMMLFASHGHTQRRTQLFLYSSIYSGPLRRNSSNISYPTVQTSNTLSHFPVGHRKRNHSQLELIKKEKDDFRIRYQ